MPHPESQCHTAGLFLSPKGVQSMWQAPRCTSRRTCTYLHWTEYTEKNEVSEQTEIQNKRRFIVCTLDLVSFRLEQLQRLCKTDREVLRQQQKELHHLHAASCQHSQTHFQTAIESIASSSACRVLSPSDWDRYSNTHRNTHRKQGFRSNT